MSSINTVFYRIHDNCNIKMEKFHKSLYFTQISLHFLVFFSVAFWTNLASAAFLIEYQAPTDPTTQGFSTWLAIPPAPQVLSPIANDMGYPSWSISGLDLSSQFFYLSGALDAAQKADINSQGFTLTLRGRVLQGNAPAYDAGYNTIIGGAELNTESIRYAFWLGINTSGNVVVVLPTYHDALGPGGSERAFGPSYTLNDANYHTYDLVLNPSTKLASLFVDGVERISGYTGHSYAPQDLGLLFGALSGGGMNFNLVRLTSPAVTPVCNARNLEPDQWHLISPLPLDGGATTVGRVVGDDVQAGNLPSSIYGNAGADGWIMYQNNAVTDQYEVLSLSSPLAVGLGYWIKTLSAGQSFQVCGKANNPTPVALTTAPNPADGRFNMLGHPYNHNVCWSDAQISNDGFTTILNPVTADPDNICDTDPVNLTCVMSRKMYQWNGAAYQTFDGVTLGAEGVLGAFDGFFVKVFKPGYQLRVPASPSCNNAAAALTASVTTADPLQTTATRGRTASQARYPEEWGLRLIVSAGKLTDPGNLLGQLKDSLDGYDAHDLDERPAGLSPYLTLVFPHPEWGLQTHDYTTDYRTPASRRAGVTDWDFEVRSDVPRTITLTWKTDRADILDKSRLIDVENQVTVMPKKANHYTIPMAGKTHRFKWQVRVNR